MGPDGFLRQYESVMRAHDLDGAMSMIAPDAEYWFSTGTRHAGHQNIRQAIARNFELIEQEDYRIHDIRWLVQTDACAVCLYRYTWSGTIRGQTMSGTGRGTNVLRRDDLGWQIVHEHLSKPAG